MWKNFPFQENYYYYVSRIDWCPVNQCEKPRSFCCFFSQLDSVALHSIIWNGVQHCLAPYFGMCDFMFFLNSKLRMIRCPFLIFDSIVMMSCCMNMYTYLCIFHPIMYCVRQYSEVASLDVRRQSFVHSSMTSRHESSSWRWTRFGTQCVKTHIVVDEQTFLVSPFVLDSLPSAVHVSTCVY